MSISFFHIPTYHSCQVLSLSGSLLSPSLFLYLSDLSPCTVFCTLHSSFCLSVRVSKLQPELTRIVFAFRWLRCQFSHSPLVYFGSTYLGTVSGLVSFAAQLPVVGYLGCCLTACLSGPAEVSFASVSQSGLTLCARQFVAGKVCDPLIWPSRAVSPPFEPVNFFIAYTLWQFFSYNSRRHSAPFPAAFFCHSGKSEKRNKAKCKSWHSQFSHVSQIVVSQSGEPSGSITAFTAHVNKYTTCGAGRGGPRRRVIGASRRRLPLSLIDNSVAQSEKQNHRQRADTQQQQQLNVLATRQQVKQTAIERCIGRQMGERERGSERQRGGLER